MKNEKPLLKDLEKLFNIHGVDNELSTPDFILAQAVVNQLNSLKAFVMDRNQWMHGKVFPSPTPTPSRGEPIRKNESPLMADQVDNDLGDS